MLDEVSRPIGEEAHPEYRWYPTKGVVNRDEPGYGARMLAAIRKMFSAGTRLPDALQAQIESEGVLFVANRVAVVRRFSGSIPGLHSGASISRTAGALALTSDRIVATLASRSNPSQRVVDCRWDATTTGPLKVEISERGVHLDVDVARVDPGFHGQLSLHYKAKMPAALLDGLPRTSLAVDVAASDVSLILGVRPRT